MTWNVIGQERAVSLLQRAIEHQRLSHAYLFAGPERVGRATTARAFAQALNCEQGGVAGEVEAEGFNPQRSSAVPCGECRTCRLIAEDKHPDVEWVTVGGVCDESDHRDHSVDNSRDIRICQVRHIERVISRTTVDARYRVVVVEPAESMTPDASNAFLKTLEEPAPSTILILITAAEERIPETVRSRCRRVAFHGVPRAAIERALIERWDAAPEEAATLAALAQGRLGWAVEALQDGRVLAERDRILDDIESVMAGNVAARFTYAANLGSRYSRDANAVRASLDIWSNWWRDVLVTAAGQESALMNPSRLDTLRAQAAQYGVKGALDALRAITAGSKHLEERASPTLAMEAMLLELPLPQARP